MFLARTFLAVVLSVFILSSSATGQDLERNVDALRIELAVKHLVDGQPITFTPELERVVLLTEQARALLGQAAKAPEVPQRRLSTTEVFYHYVVQPLTQRRTATGDQLAAWRKWSASAPGGRDE